jgi:hypothetical protein
MRGSSLLRRVCQSQFCNKSAIGVLYIELFLGTVIEWFYSKALDIILSDISQIFLLRLSIFKFFKLRLFFDQTKSVLLLM